MMIRPAELVECADAPAGHDFAPIDRKYISQDSAMRWAPPRGIGQPTA